MHWTARLRARALLCVLALSTLGATLLAPTLAAQSPVIERPRPPISPGKAFLASALVPGLGQSELNRGTGLLFVTVEAIALTMYAKSRHDLSIAERFRRDSTPLTYAIDPSTGVPQRDTTGALVVTTWSSSRYGIELVRARRTHVEDWVAVLIFNHVFAGIDAFVAAHLWDLPAQVQMRAHPGGVRMQASVPW